MEKRLYKSSTDKKLAGVCGGLAEYFGLDSTLVRIGYAALILFAGTGLLLYIICAFVMPNKPME
jgi:phage shock protein C